MEARPGREGGIGAPRMHDVQGDFGIGEKLLPVVVREVRVGGGEDRDEVVFVCPYCPLCRVGSVCGGTNVTGDHCERK